jgi:hypothetical protein
MPAVTVEIFYTAVAKEIISKIWQPLCRNRMSQTQTCARRIAGEQVPGDHRRGASRSMPTSPNGEWLRQTLYRISEQPARPRIQFSHYRVAGKWSASPVRRRTSADRRSVSTRTAFRRSCSVRADRRCAVGACDVAPTRPSSQPRSDRQITRSRTDNRSPPAGRRICAALRRHAGPSPPRPARQPTAGRRSRRDGRCGRPGPAGCRGRFRDSC